MEAICPRGCFEIGNTDGLPDVSLLVFGQLFGFGRVNLFDGRRIPNLKGSVADKVAAVRREAQAVRIASACVEREEFLPGIDAPKFNALVTRARQSASVRRKGETPNACRMSGQRRKGLPAI